MGLMAFGLLTWRFKYAIILPIGLLINGFAFWIYGTDWISTVSAHIRYTPREIVDGGRSDIWQQGISLLTSAPITGSGYGSIEDLFEMTRISPYFTRTSHLHTEPLEILIVHGLAAGNLLLLIWIWVLGRGLKRIYAIKPKSKAYMLSLSAFWSGLVALSIQSCIDLSFRSQSVILLGAILLGPLWRSRKAIPRYTALLPISTAFLFTVFAIFLHNTPETAYSHSSYWMTQAQKSNGQFARTAYRNAAISRPLYAKAFLDWGLHVYPTDQDKALKLVSHASQLAPRQFVNWMALAGYMHSRRLP